jgi:hypothetical protein
MKILKLSVPFALASAVAGLIFVSPALSSKGSVHRVDAPLERPANTKAQRSTRPPGPAKAAAMECATERRSLWTEGEGWIVRRVSICN